MFGFLKVKERKKGYIFNSIKNELNHLNLKYENMGDSLIVYSNRYQNGGHTFNSIVISINDNCTINFKDPMRRQISGIPEVDHFCFRKQLLNIFGVISQNMLITKDEMVFCK